MLYDCCYYSCKGQFFFRSYFQTDQDFQHENEQEHVPPPPPRRKRRGGGGGRYPYGHRGKQSKCCRPVVSLLHATNLLRVNLPLQYKRMFIYRNLL